MGRSMSWGWEGWSWERKREGGCVEVREERMLGSIVEKEGGVFVERMDGEEKKEQEMVVGGEKGWENVSGEEETGDVLGERSVVEVECCRGKVIAAEWDWLVVAERTREVLQDEWR